MQFSTIYSAHNFLRFGETYSRGWICAGRTQHHVDQSDPQGTIIASHTIQSLMAPNLSENAPEGTDFQLILKWRAPETILRFGRRRTDSEIPGNNDQSQPSSREELFVFPSLPIELIEELIVADEQHKIRLKEFLALEESPPNVELHESELEWSDAPGYLPLQKDASEIWESSARKARMLSFGLAFYRKRTDGAEINFDHSTHRANAFIQGVSNFDKITTTKLNRVSKDIENDATALLEKPLKLQTLREPRGYSLDDLLPRIDPNQNLPTMGELESPDRCFFRLILEELSNRSLMPYDADSWLFHLLDKIDLERLKLKPSDDSFGIWDEFLKVAQKVLSNTSSVSYTSFISKYSRKYPALSAAVVYFTSDQYDDQKSLHKRMGGLGVASEQVRWLADVFFGLVNGYMSTPFSRYYKRYPCSKEAFIHSFDKFLCNALGTNPESGIDNPKYVISLKLAEDNSGGSIAIGNLSGIQDLLVRLTDPVASIVEKMDRVAKRAESDSDTRRRLEDAIDDLALGFHSKLCNCFVTAIRLKSGESELVVQKSNVKILGDWEIKREFSPSGLAALRSFIDDKKAFGKHVALHKGAFDVFLSRESKHWGKK